MKTILLFMLVGTFSSAEKIFIDWSTVKPISEYSEFSGVASPPGKSDEPNKFVINGNLAQPFQFPNHVALVSEMAYGNALCSGSLISRRSILTAASCLSGANSAAVILGATDLMKSQQRYQARLRVHALNFIIHPEYIRNGRLLSNDIGIVRLPHSIAFFTPAVNVVRLPQPYHRNFPFEATPTITMG